MKKVIIIATFIILAPQACGDILYVGGEGNYKKIQDAIDNANFFDKIIVYPGVYEENITINKSIFLEGKDVIVSGGIFIFANNVNISGFIINNSILYGISVKGNRNTIKNCSLFSNSYGIKIEGEENFIENNKIFKNGFYGIYLYFFSKNNTITKNEIYESKVGIYIEKATDNLIIENVIRNNSAGMIIQGGENNLIRLNNFSGNLEGIHMCCYSKNNIIFENNFIGNSKHVYCYAEKNIWNLSNGNYWDNLSGEIFFIDEENIDYLPSKSPYEIGSSAYKIYIFYPEENSTLSGKIIIQGMVEKEGVVRIRIDNNDWENTTGNFLWYYLLDTKNLSDGKHEIYVEFEGDIISRTIYIKNKKSIPSFELILILMAFLFIFKNRKNYL
ncbi:MAG: right-handed parallel beta-helix repeat-containing protein [Thermoplasmatales archaeon]|nr:right-handed parallel beta-helix repeat-containing protein [Thermoplasmatales archaeon]